MYKIILLALFLIMQLESKLFTNEFGYKKATKDSVLVKKGYGKYKITLYHSKVQSSDKEPEYFYFYLPNSKSKKWVNTPKNLFNNIEYLDIVNKKYLLFSASTNLWSASYLLDIYSAKLYPLGGGKAEYLGNNMFILHGAKGYASKNGEPLGAYWANKVVDINGNLIKFLKSGNSCYPLKYLIDKDLNYPKLEQKLDDIVCVEQ
jgi:hypothetical protein